MKVAELAADHAFLFLWATGPKLELAFDLIRCWGFTYKTVHHVWATTYAGGAAVVGAGYYTRPSCEFVLVGTRGSPLGRFNLDRSIPQLIHAYRSPVHSEKPPEVFDAIELFAEKATHKIELFARRRRIGWDVWGKEVVHISKRKRGARKRRINLDVFLLP